MDFSIIIPSFNSVSALRKNLPRIWLAIESLKTGKAELIVVDDASTDDTLSFLANFAYGKENFHSLVNKNNLGFSRACNVAAAQAKGRFLIFLNSDVYPERNFLQYVSSHFNDELVFAVGFLEKSLDLSGQVIDERGVGELFFKDGIFQHVKGVLSKGITDWVCGGSGAFRRSIFLELGGFDPYYSPFYWEDIDLSYRAKKKGYKLLFDQRIIIYHQHDEGAIMRHFKPEEIENISFINQLKFTLRHAKTFRQRIAFVLFLIVYGLKKVKMKIFKSLGNRS